VTLLVPCLQGNYPLMALVASLQRSEDPLVAWVAISSGNTTPRGLTCCRSTGNKTTRGLSAAMSLGHTIPSWPWVVSLQGITLKTALSSHKTYHACLFFNLSLALLSPKFIAYPQLSSKICLNCTNSKLFPNQCTFFL
jgi:hypothetical protein